MFRLQNTALAFVHANVLSDEADNEAVDAALVFFVWAHSLRDWLINDAGIEVTKLDGLLVKNPSWKVCRDLGNRQRHPVLSIKPQDGNWFITRVTDPDRHVLKVGPTNVMYLFHNKWNRPLFVVINDIGDMWRSILNELKLPLSAQLDDK